jgi:hypothetical protein
MAITVPYLNLIIKKHKHKALTGESLLIGKQTIGIKHSQLKKYLI